MPMIRGVVVSGGGSVKEVTRPRFVFIGTIAPIGHKDTHHSIIRAAHALAYMMKEQTSSLFINTLIVALNTNDEDKLKLIQSDYFKVERDTANAVKEVNS